MRWCSASSAAACSHDRHHVVLLWFAGTALLAAWFVFRDPSFDHRLLIVGALLPDLIDAPFGGARVAHALLAPVAVLVVVMLSTQGRRPLRKSLLAIPIGMLLHLVFDGAFREATPFWWPFTGTLGSEPLPSIARGWWNVPLELVGLAILAGFWRFWGLGDPARRSRFLREGKVAVGGQGSAPTC
jgi:hypothetical protein